MEGENHDLEAKLIDDLIENYNSIYVRPNRDPVVVGFRFSPTILKLVSVIVLSTGKKMYSHTSLRQKNFYLLC